LLKRPFQYSAALTLGAAVLFGGLCGCATPARIAGLSQAPVDPTSPVAQDVIRAARHPGPFPKFASIPAIPKDVRPDSQWKAAVEDMKSRQAKLDNGVASLPPLTDDTEAYASQTREKLGPPPGPAPPPNSRQQTEAEGRALRERATPPPLPK
jgi:hypothetical protein